MPHLPGFVKLFIGPLSAATWELVPGALSIEPSYFGQAPVSSTFVNKGEYLIRFGDRSATACRLHREGGGAGSLSSVLFFAASKCVTRPARSRVAGRTDPASSTERVFG